MTYGNTCTFRALSGNRVTIAILGLKRWLKSAKESSLKSGYRATSVAGLSQKCRNWTFFACNLAIF